MYSPETQSRMAHLRARAADSTITEEELREAVRLMREDRYAVLQSQAAKSAAGGSATRRGKPKAAPVNVGDLFGQLDKI